MYARDSEFNNVKFGYVMSEILLPMALDYRIRSRNTDVEELAQKELPNLNVAARKDKAIKVGISFLLFTHYSYVQMLLLMTKRTSRFTGHYH